jgi:hypothetical protein
MSVLAVKAEGTNDPLTALAPHVKTAVDKELEKLEMLLKDSKRKWNISFPERVLESGEVIEKSAKVDIDHHEYRSSMGTNFVAIYRFPSIDDASASMRRWIAQPPIQPPLEIPGLGDAAVRFPGKTLEATGSYSFGVAPLQFTSAQEG